MWVLQIMFFFSNQNFYELSFGTLKPETLLKPKSIISCMKRLIFLRQKSKKKINDAINLGGILMNKSITKQLIEDYSHNRLIQVEITKQLFCAMHFLFEFEKIKIYHIIIQKV
jgi:hypothetical protein